MDAKTEPRDILLVQDTVYTGITPVLNTHCPSFERQKESPHLMKGAIFVFAFLLTRIYAHYECSMSGYEEYLTQYSMKCGDDCDAYKE